MQYSTIYNSTEYHYSSLCTRCWIIFFLLSAVSFGVQQHLCYWMDRNCEWNFWVSVLVFFWIPLMHFLYNCKMMMTIMMIPEVPKNLKCTKSNAGTQTSSDETPTHRLSHVCFKTLLNVNHTEWIAKVWEGFNKMWQRAMVLEPEKPENLHRAEGHNNVGLLGYPFFEKIKRPAGQEKRVNITVFFRKAYCCICVWITSWGDLLITTTAWKRKVPQCLQIIPKLLSNECHSH